MTINTSRTIESQKDETVLRKQYEIIIDIYKTESGRFWTRFNIFISIELACFIGILTNIKLLAVNIDIFRWFLIFCMLLSMLVVMISIRGISTQKILLGIISDIETSSDTLIQLSKIIKSKDNLPQYVNPLISLFIASLFLLGWICLFIYLEKMGYHINIPK